MADLRMLQEQAQLLQNMLGTLTDALKAVNARLDQQAEATRKSVADEKLLIDTLTKDLSIVREKVDDNNVRVGSLAQEVDALRQLVQQALSRQPAQTTDLTAPGPTPRRPRAQHTCSGTPPPTAGASPTKTYEQAYGDFAAASGPDRRIRRVPQGLSHGHAADEAQFYIGRAC
jgi:hypothetical protein